MVLDHPMKLIRYSTQLQVYNIVCTKSVYSLPGLHWDIPHWLKCEEWSSLHGRMSFADSQYSQARVLFTGWFNCWPSLTLMLATHWSTSGVRRDQLE